MPEQPAGPAPPEDGVGDGQSLLGRVEHWCRLQPDKVGTRCVVYVCVLCTPFILSNGAVRCPPYTQINMQVAFTFLDDHGREVDKLTYKVGRCV